MVFYMCCIEYIRTGYEYEAYVMPWEENAFSLHFSCHFSGWNLFSFIQYLKYFQMPLKKTACPSSNRIHIFFPIGMFTYTRTQIKRTSTETVHSKIPIWQFCNWTSTECGQVCVSDSSLYIWHPAEDAQILVWQGRRFFLTTHSGHSGYQER